MAQTQLEIVALGCRVETRIQAFGIGDLISVPQQGIGFGRARAPTSCFIGTEWVRLIGDWVGRHHSAILPSVAGWSLHHSGTTNPTLCNGERVGSTRLLVDQDLIEISNEGHRVAAVFRLHLLHSPDPLEPIAAPATSAQTEP